MATGLTTPHAAGYRTALFTPPVSDTEGAVGAVSASAPSNVFDLPISGRGMSDSVDLTTPALAKGPTGEPLVDEIVTDFQHGGNLPDSEMRIEAAMRSGALSPQEAKEALELLNSHKPVVFEEEDEDEVGYQPDIPGDSAVAAEAGAGLSLLVRHRRPHFKGDGDREAREREAREREAEERKASEREAEKRDAEKREAEKRDAEARDAPEQEAGDERSHQEKSEKPEDKADPNPSSPKDPDLAKAPDEEAHGGDAEISRGIDAAGSEARGAIHDGAGVGRDLEIASEARDARLVFRAAEGAKGLVRGTGLWIVVEAAVVGAVSAGAVLYATGSTAKAAEVGGKLAYADAVPEASRDAIGKGDYGGALKAFAGNLWDGVKDIAALTKKGAVALYNDPRGSAAFVANAVKTGGEGVSVIYRTVTNTGALDAGARMFGNYWAGDTDKAVMAGKDFFKEMKRDKPLGDSVRSLIESTDGFWTGLKDKTGILPLLLNDNDGDGPRPGQKPRTNAVVATLDHAA